MNSELGEADMKVPTVFISYSHDSPQHADCVLEFSNSLRIDGIDCTLDQYEVSPPEGWPMWMESHIEKSDFIIVICTETYCSRFKGQQEDGKGLGVKFESVLTHQHIYNDNSKNTRFIPVLFNPDDIKNIPTLLQGVTRYCIDTEQGYEDLYRRLTDQPRVSKPKLGKLCKLPALERKHDFFKEIAKIIPQIPAPADQYYKPEIQASDEEVKIIIKEKYPGASNDYPITFTGSFITPKTPEGDKVRKEIDDFFNKGTTAEIEKQFFKGFELPNFITQVFGESEIDKIKLESNPPKNPIRVRIDMFSSEEILCASYYDELVIQRQGKEETVIISQNQSKPFQFEIVLNSADKTDKFWFNFNISGNANVKQWLDAVLFNNAIAKGEAIVITDLDTGIEFRSPIKNKQTEPLPEGFIHFWEDLVFIQTKTKCPIIYTASRVISDDDEKTIYELRHILTTGQLKGTWDSSSGELYKNAIISLLDEIKKLPNDPISFTILENQSFYEILDIKISIGPRKTTFENAIIENSIEELENFIKSSSDKDVLLVRLRPSKPNSKALTIYKNWLPKNNEDPMSIQ